MSRRRRTWSPPPRPHRSPRTLAAHPLTFPCTVDDRATDEPTEDPCDRATVDGPSVHDLAWLDEAEIEAHRVVPGTLGRLAGRLPIPPSEHQLDGSRAARDLRSRDRCMQVALAMAGHRLLDPGSDWGACQP